MKRINKWVISLLISLDFELFCGVYYCHTYDTYVENVLGGRKAIPKLLDIFEKYDIHATWLSLYPNHEIGSHTFSHYYAREEGQNIDEFEADIKAAKNIAVAKGYDAKTLVFPRNQSKDEYESVMISNGYVAYRGEEQDWIHKIPVNPIKRIFRLADLYVNLTGSATYSKDDFCPGKLHNFRGSRFLSPFNHILCFLEKLKLHRVKGQMK